MAKPNRPETQTGDCHDQRHHTGVAAAIFRAGASRPRSNGRHGGRYARGCADPQPHPLRGGAEPHLQPRLLLAETAWAPCPTGSTYHAGGAEYTLWCPLLLPERVDRQVYGAPRLLHDPARDTHWRVPDHARGFGSSEHRSPERGGTWRHRRSPWQR